MPTTSSRLATGSILALVVLAVVVLALVACSAPTGSVSNVTIEGGSETVVVGDTLSLTAAVATTGGADDGVAWSSSVENVATVDSSGILEALTPGATTVTAASTADPSMSDSVTVTVAAPGSLAWTRQFGTRESELASGIATDANGNVYATGHTFSVPEGTVTPVDDTFIRSYDGSGDLRWTREIPTSSSENTYGIAADTNGNVYAIGSTDGALAEANAGIDDVFIRSYDGDGTYRWTRQFGSSGNDIGRAIATDANGNVYAAGHTTGTIQGTATGTTDAFVRSYDSDGEHRWTRQFGTSDGEEAWGIATDANGNVYVTGRTDGALDGASAGGSDAFVRSYDSDGNHRWTRQYGTTTTDAAYGIATDADGNVYATGHTFGALRGANAGNEDAYVRSYDSDGNHRWTRQYGTSSRDRGWAVATSARGNVYAGAYTEGALEGSSAGGDDAYVRSYDSDGTLRWTRQFGTSSDDEVRGIATDLEGNVYTVGRTEGALEGTHKGLRDGFVRKYGP